MTTLTSWVFLLTCGGCWAVITAASSHNLTFTGSTWMSILAVIRVTALIMLCHVPETWYFELLTRVVMTLICTVTLSVLSMASFRLTDSNSLIVSIVLLVLANRGRLLVVHASCRWGLSFTVLCGILSWDADSMGDLVTWGTSHVWELH